MLEYEAIQADYDGLGAAMVGVISSNGSMIVEQHGTGDIEAIAAGAECPIEVWMSEANKDKSISAMRAEKQAMLDKRWTVRDPNSLSDKAKKLAARARYVNVIKRDGRHKSRIVLTTPDRAIQVHKTLMPVYHRLKASF